MSPLSCLPYDFVLVRGEPPYLDILVTESVDLLPDSYPNVDHWVGDAATVPSSSAEGVTMVDVIGDDANGWYGML